MSEYTLIKDARCAFPHLFGKPIINGAEGKAGCKFLLEVKQHAATIAEIKAKITELAQEKWKAKTLAPEKLCLRNGSELERPEYEGHFVLSTSTLKDPIVVDRTLARITDPRDCPIYGGCRVNAKVRLWVQDNKFGRRINCELITIQFGRDDEPLDSHYVSHEEAVEGFDAVADDDYDPLAA